MEATLYFKLQTKTCRADENSSLNVSACLAPAGADPRDRLVYSTPADDALNFEEIVNGPIGIFPTIA